MRFVEEFSFAEEFITCQDVIQQERLFRRYYCENYLLISIWQVLVLIAPQLDKNQNQSFQITYNSLIYS